MKMCAYMCTYIYSVYTRYHACYINKYIRVCTLGTHVVWYIKIQ